MYRCVIPAAVVAAAAAIVTAGCASAGATGLGAREGAASVVPGNAVVFIASDTHVDSAQWHGLAKPFLKQYGAYEPALGDELDIAVLPNRQEVALTQPSDAAKLTALAAKHNAKTRAIGGWTAIAKTTAALDAVSNATSHLTDSTAFTQAMSSLPDSALVRIYANGDQAEQVLQQLHGQLQSSGGVGGIRFRY